MNNHQESLLEALRWLQTSQEYSDLKIFCQEQVFHVHKAIVCSQSEYFATACTCGKDDVPKKEIDLADDDATIVGLLLNYLYQLDYDDLSPNQALAQQTESSLAESSSTLTTNATAQKGRGVENLGETEIIQRALLPEPIPEPEEPVPLVEADVFGDDGWGLTPKRSKKDKKKRKDLKPRLEEPIQDLRVERLEVNTMVYSLADKYDIPNLKPRLKEPSQDLRVERLVVNTMVYSLADKYDIPNLKTLAKEKFATAVTQDWDSQAFLRAAELAFETTPSSDQGLRAIIIGTLNEHRELMDYEEIQKLLNSGNGIAWEFLKVVLQPSQLL